VWESVAVSPAQDRRPVLTVSGSTSSSLLAAMGAVVTKDMEISGLIHKEKGMDVYSAQEQEAKVAENEKLRRLRISKANKGKVPWNKGHKHSAGMLCQHCFPMYFVFCITGVYIFALLSAVF
jgi:hypothetical protein